MLDNLDLFYLYKDNFFIFKDVIVWKSENEIECDTSKELNIICLKTLYKVECGKLWKQCVK